MKKRSVKFLLAVAALAVLAVGVAAPAQADDDHGRGPRVLTLKGVITNVAVTDSGQILTIDRGACG